MKILEDLIKSAIVGVIEKEFPGFEDADPEIQKTGNPAFGDYQTNFALKNAGKMKSSPVKIAMALKEHIAALDMVDRCDVAGPGFINIFLDDDFLGKYVQIMDPAKAEYDIPDRDGTLIIDYSSPNIAKPMHVGHLRSTVIGDSLKRVFRFLGYSVVADNHLGDWGTQFGKLIVGYRNWLDRALYKDDPIAELERIYILFEQKSSDDPALIEQAREELKRLQDGDEDNLGLWKEFVSVSMDEYAKTYRRMDIEFDTYHGESFFHNLMPGVVDELVKKGLAKESEGALVVFFDEAENLHPCVIKKNDGAFLYATSDLACILFRKKEYDINRLVYVTDARQESHFRQVFAIKDMLGWDVAAEHVPFGLMGLADGHFSSRRGNVIKLKDLLDEAKKRAAAIVEEKNPGLSPGEKDRIAETVGLGAVKYSDLSQNRVSNIVFDWDKMLNFEGNTAPYLQYTYARISSLIRKARENGKYDGGMERVAIRNNSERVLALTLSQFFSSVAKAGETYRPNIIADQLFETAQRFNSFYNSLPVLKAEGVSLPTRLMLAEKTAFILKTGLGLLGIQTVERM